MDIKISSIGDKGNLANERIGFTVLNNCELKYYMIIKTRLTGNKTFFHKSDAAYWFLPREVKAKDQLVLYTKSGSESVIENADGTKIYFFYWGLDKAIFENDEKRIVLVNADSWLMNEDAAPPAVI